MATPDFQSFFYPFLKLSSDKAEHSLSEIREFMVSYFKLNDFDISQKVPSGTQTKFNNRIYWAKSFLGKAKLIESTKRSHFMITERGLDFLKKFSGSIKVKDLREFEEFREFHQNTNSGMVTDSPNNPEILISDERTPLEKLEESYQFIQNELAMELLEKVKTGSWQFFEDLVVDLMVKMGYGGSRRSVGHTIKRNNDEGIDGIINEDKLGLDVIYIQAKKWTKQGGIGRPEIQKFVGALHGKHAKKGVFITTSFFAKTAYEYVKSIEPKVILIDGEYLSQLMIEYDLGTSIVGTYQIKKMDLDYFEE